MASNLPGPSNFNPFHEVSSWLGSLSQKGQENARYQQTMHAIASQHQANIEHLLTAHTLEERAKSAELRREGVRHKRTTTARFDTMKMAANIARGGGQVTAGDVSVNLPKPPVTPTAAPAKGRVPVKRNRGGKKNI